MSSVGVLSKGGETNEVNEVLAVLNTFGFASPTSIQAIAIPKILGHELDLVIAAPTGSGKTEAALIPVLYKLAKNRLRLRPGIKVIYITPLRALNRDINNRIQHIAKTLGFSSAVWHGDTSSDTRKKILGSPPDILITTPESLQVLLVKKEIRENLQPIYAIVVDEAQELISSERGTELVVALERLDSAVGRRIRRILISSPIGDIDRMAQYFFSGKRYDVAYTTGSKKYAVDVVLSDKNYMNGIFSLTHVFDYLCKNIVIKESGSQVLVFTNTRTSAEELGYNLAKCLGESVALHHSSLSRNLREVVEAMFKNSSLQVVVATSSLELGIDIGGVDLVIQYLSPRQALKLIQRVGRAGHRESAVSRGIIVVPPLITELVESIVISRRASRGLLEKPKPHTESLDVLAHQIVGVILEKGVVNLNEIWSIISRATPFSTLTLSRFEAIVNFLNSINMIRCSNDSCKSTKKGLLYYLTTNMIPDAAHYTTRSILDGRTVGILDEEFALSCNEDDVIILAGKLWKIVSVDIDKREVVVSPIETSELAVLPRWIGETIPVHRNVARETCAFIRRFCKCTNSICLDILFNEYNINPVIRSFLEENREKLCKIYPSDNMLIVEVNHIKDENKSIIAFYTCLGSKASEAFSILVNYLIRDVLGVSSAYKSHQLGTVVLVNTTIDKGALTALIRKLLLISKNSDKVRELIEHEIKNTSIFKHRLISVAKKFGIISKNAESNEIKRVIEGLMNIDILVQETLRELYVDKIDIDTLIKYLSELANNKLKIKIFLSKSPSPYIEEMSSLGLFRSLIKQSLIPKDIMIEIAKRRLIDREVKMFCVSCYYTWNFRIGEKVNQCKDVFSCFIECPQCKSRAITIIDNDSEVALLKKVIEKAKKGVNSYVKLLSSEKEILNKHKKIADFVMSHGLAGIIALQGTGVGIETAKKILARSSDLNSLILGIVEQEKLFLRTYKYWKRRS